jgi:RimJ/RimL family protein N-acetyltransferase
MIGSKHRLPPETIPTDRLILRRPRLSDAADIYEYGGDPEVTRYMDWPTHSSLQDALDYIQAAERSWESGQEYSWVIARKPDDKAIGGVGCRVRGHAVDLGYVLARNEWRRGYASEAARAVREWASSLDSIYRVWATCDVENAASARVLEKIGMSREGILRRWAIRPNLASRAPRDAFVYSWIREP